MDGLRRDDLLALLDDEGVEREFFSDCDPNQEHRRGAPLQVVEGDAVVALRAVSVVTLWLLTEADADAVLPEAFGEQCIELIQAREGTHGQ